MNYKQESTEFCTPNEIISLQLTETNLYVLTHHLV